MIVIKNVSGKRILIADIYAGSEGPQGEASSMRKASKKGVYFADGEVKALPETSDVIDSFVNGVIRNFIGSGKFELIKHPETLVPTGSVSVNGKVGLASPGDANPYPAATELPENVCLHGVASHYSETFDQIANQVPLFNTYNNTVPEALYNLRIKGTVTVFAPGTTPNVSTALLELAVGGAGALQEGAVLLTKSNNKQPTGPVQISRARFLATPDTNWRVGNWAILGALVNDGVWINAEALPGGYGIYCCARAVEVGTPNNIADAMQIALFSVINGVVTLLAESAAFTLPTDWFELGLAVSAEGYIIGSYNGKQIVQVKLPYDDYVDILDGQTSDAPFGQQAVGAGLAGVAAGAETHAINIDAWAYGSQA